MMKKKLLLTSLTILLLVMVALPAGAQNDVDSVEPDSPAPSAENGIMTYEGTDLWFVEFNGATLADGGSNSGLKAERDAFKRNAKAAKINYTERFDFKTLWNGLSIRVSNPADVAELSRLSGVRAIYPVVAVAMPESVPAADDPELATALAMTGADIAQNSLGLTGAGIRVAVMDTGLDYDHPDLGGCFGAGCRVVTGWDFVGDAFNADSTSPLYNPVAVPDNDPDDCNGHGTHVSGIVGASGDPSTGGVRGVAPGVTFGAYRVFGCNGSTTSDIMIAAMEMALADGSDVLNMSIGSAFQWPDYPTAEASDRAVNHGMVVVASIGNSGVNGQYAAGAPGLGAKVIGVASFDNTHVALPVFTISPDGTAIGYTNATAAPPAPTSGSLPMARTGTPTTNGDGCINAPAPGTMTGKAVLIRRGSQAGGTCGFYDKALAAQNAGAAAVVLYNNVPGRINPTVAGPLAITIPVVAISDTEGILINNRLAAGPVTLTWTTNSGSFLNATGGLISAFSSYGLSPDLTVKPDIGAPGGQIRSTYPLELGGYATISGTSMASPHVAGAVALLLEAHPNTSAQVVDEIFQNSADPKNWQGNPGLGFLDQVHRQGAGMIDIDDSILATTRVSPSEIAMGESETGAQTHSLNLSNSSGADVTYTLSFVNALSTNSNVNAPGASTSNASVAFSALGVPVTSVTVPAGGSASVDATINPATGPAFGQYGGYIVFTPQGGGQVYRVPFAGFVGDYQARVALLPTPFGFPWVAKTTNGTGFSNNAAGVAYTMQGFDVPYIALHLEVQVRSLKFTVYDLNGKSWHVAYKEDYVGRNSTSTGFFAYAWDGTTLGGNKVYTVPDGQYYIVVEVVKALGDASNPAHVETWTSPTITIDRP